MYNCVAVKRNEEIIAYFKTIDAAEMYRQLMQQTFGHLEIQWNVDWAYIEGLRF